MRWLATVAGVIGGASASVGGIMMFITNIISGISAILGSVLMIMLGFLIFVLEATFCCRAISFAQPIITRMDRIKFWHKGCAYCGYVLKTQEN